MFQSLLQSQTAPLPIQLKRYRGLDDASETGQQDHGPKYAMPKWGSKSYNVYLHNTQKGLH